MKGIKVVYTVKSDYVSENKKRINAVMKELREINNSNFKYYSTVMDDGKTFMHIVLRETEGADDLPGNLESFKNFQAGLKENLEIKPNVENFEVVDSSFDLF